MSVAGGSRFAQGVVTAALLALFAFAIFGPLTNLLLWAFAEKWYFPSKLPSEFGLSFWVRVFNPRGTALASLGTSVWIAVLTVVVSLAVAIPAGYALARLRLPFRGVILLLFFGLSGHNLLRYQWVWFAAFQAVAVHCVRRRAALAEAPAPAWGPRPAPAVGVAL